LMPPTDAMAEEQYKDYLAARVLTEHRPVTYRLLSRALKTNVNTAKRSVQVLPNASISSPSDRMLFAFHEKQNARKPGSVHATYLLTGTPRRVRQSNGVSSQINDTDMRSSPFRSTMPEAEESGESDDSEYASGSDDEDTPAPRGVRETHVVLVPEEDLEGAFW